MPRILFSENFDFRVNNNVQIAYRAGAEYLVSQECARQALEKGVGKKVPTRNKRTGVPYPSADLGPAIWDSKRDVGG